MDNLISSLSFALSSLGACLLSLCIYHIIKGIVNYFDRVFKEDNKKLIKETLKETKKED